MTKRKKAMTAVGICLSVLTLGTSIYSLTDGFKNFSPNDIANEVIGENVEIVPVEGIKFVKVTQIDEGTAYTKKINYTLDPVDSTEEFNFSLAWVEEESASFEPGFSANTDMSQYLTYEADTVNKTLTFHCLKPFGRQATFMMQAQTNIAIRASLKIDYVRKVLKATGVNFSDMLANGKNFTATPVSAVYSIGSKGVKAGDTKTIETSFSSNDNSNYTYDKMFTSLYDVNTTGNFTYQSNTYTTSDEVLAKMKTAVNDYITSIPSFDGAKTFSSDEFKELLTYKRTFHVSDYYEPTYAYSNEYQTFLTNYANAVSKGAGYVVSVKYQDEFFRKVIPIEDASAYLNTITIGGDIEF